VTDPVIFSLNGDSGEQDRLGVYDDFAGTENRPGDFTPGLVSLGFIKAAIRRRAWFLTFLTVVGLIGGFGAYVKYPHSYQASASVLVTLSPYEDSLTAATNNQAIADTTPVAALAVRQLGLRQSASSFLSSYGVVSVTSRLMTITASGPSADQAVLRAGAVANAFLTFRANTLRSQQNLVTQSLSQQVDQAKQQLNSLDTQIAQLSGQPSQLGKLQAERTSVVNTQSSLQQAVGSNQATTEPALTAALKNSQVLGVTALPFKKKKILATDLGVGLIAGLIVGLSIIILQALVSDRLRRRDDVAYTLDAPVKLSVRTLGARRRLVPWPGRAARRNRDLRHVITQLHSAVPRRTQSLAALAVVAVDNAPVVAKAVAALATSYASEGAQVVTADLSRGAYLAHLLGVKKPGVHAVSRNGVTFTLAVPDRDDPAPVGALPPLASPTGLAHPGAAHAGPVHAGEALVASDVAADLVLTLATLDPATGGDHLGTWGTSAVVVVSAGRSSAERVHGVGEMIRLAGMRLDSVVLLGADKSDESIGQMRRTEEQAGVGVLGR
jgi:capsular polysaccharide biosynthesis protein